jgi:hypothetical protein
VVLAAFAFMVLASHAAVGDEEQPLRIRRVFVPADNREAWPNSDERFLPVPAEEVDGLVERANAALDEETPAVRIVESVYRARWDDAQLVDGQAELKISNTTESPQLLPLEGLSIAIDEPRWQSDTRVPVQIGTWGNADEATARFGLMVDRSDRLRFEWRPPAVSTVGRQVRIPLGLPEGGARRLVLDLPVGLHPAVRGGVVVSDGTVVRDGAVDSDGELAAANDTAATGDDAPMAPATANASEERRIWEIALPGDPIIELRLLRSVSTPRDVARRGTASHHVLYEVGHRGLTLKATLILSAANGFANRLTFLVDPRMQLMSISEEGAVVPWEIETNGRATVARAVVTLPERESSTPRTIVAEAWVPLELDETWHLPQLRAEGVAWLDSEFELRLPGHFELQQVARSRDVVQTGVALPSDIVEDATYTFAGLSPEAGLQVVVARRPPRVVAEQASRIDLTAREYRGQCTTDLRIDTGQLHAIDATLATGWIVEGVTSDPPSAVRDWSIDSQPERKTLHVRLAHPLWTENSLRLLVEGRFTPAADPDRPIDAAALRMFSPDRVTVARHVMQLVAEPNWAIQFDGDQPLIAANELTAEEASRLEAPREGILLDTADATARGTIRLQRTTAASEAAVDVVVTAADERLITSYRFQQMQIGANDRSLRVVFDVPLVGDVHWFDGASGTSIAAHQAAEQPEVDAVEGRETWDVPTAQTEADVRVVEARVSSPWAGAQRVSLPRKVAGADVGGRVVVRSADARSPTVAHQELHQVLTDPLDDQERPHVVGTYRFDAAAGPDMQLSLTPRLAPTTVPRQTIQWAELNTAYSSGGRTLHQVDLYITNYDGAELALLLPEGAELDSLEVDGRTQTNTNRKQLIGIAGSSVRIVVSETQSVATLRFTTGDAPSFAITRLPAPLPSADVPVLGGRWTVWTPPGVAALVPNLATDHGPQSWRSRLFGRLARPAGRQPMNPFVASTWTDLPIADRQSRAFRVELQRVVQELGRPRSTTEPAPTWSELLVRAANELSDPNQLLVDYQALAGLGIDATTPVTPTPEANSEPATDGDVMETNAAPGQWSAKRVALLMDDGRLILTSRRTATLVGQPIAEFAVAGIAVAGFTDEPVFEMPDRSGQRDTVRRPDPHPLGPLVPAADWQSVVSTATTKPIPAPSQWNLPRDWRAVEIPFGGERPAAISVARMEPFRVISWVGFLFCLATAAVAAPRFRVPLVVATASAAMLCLLLGPLAAGIARASAGGLIVGAILYGTRRESRRPQRRAESTLVGASLIGLLVAIPQAAQAQTQTATPAPVVRPILVPVDAQRQSVGSQYFVSESLLLELNRRAARATRPAAQWSIRGAAYTGELTTASAGIAVGEASGEVGAGKWTAEFDLEVLARDTYVELPWRRDQATWPSSASLDGLPVALHWPDEGAGCQLLVSEPGIYRLAVSFVPRVVRADGQGQIEFEIPRVPDSRVHLTLPDAEQPLEIFADGSMPVAASTDGATLLAFLGPAQHVQVRWPMNTVAGDDRPSVDQLLWVHMADGEVRFSTKFGLTQDDVEPVTLPLAVDRRLAELAPAESGKITTIELLPKTAVASHDPLRFELVDAPRFGRFPLPTFELDAARIRSRRLAITCDPQLDYELVSDLGTSTVPIDDFLADWGEPDELPQRVVDITGDPSAWYLQVRPRQQVATVDGTLSLVVGNRTASCNYEGDVVPGLGEQYELRLQVPIQVRIEDIRVTIGGEPVSIRWSRPMADEVELFFSRRLTGSYRLAVEGRCDVPANREMPVPWITVGVDPVQRQRLRLFRRDNARVEFVQGDAEIQPTESATTPRPRPGARLVGTFWVNANRADEAIVMVSPNVPEAVGQSLTNVFRDSTGWVATWACQLQVQHGVMDTLELELPANWTGPLVVRPNLPIEIQSEPSSTEVTSTAATGDGATVRASVRFPEALEPGTKVRIDISGPVQTAPNDGMRIPHVRVRNAFLAARYIAVPTEVDGQSAGWTRDGVEAIDQLPTDLQSLQTTAFSAQLFRVTGEPFSMHLDNGSEVGREAVISLIDVAVRSDLAGGQLVRTRFVLQPRGLGECLLELPDDYELIDVFQGAARCIPEPAGDRRWRIPLAAPDMPHVLQVVARRTAVAHAGAFSAVARPRLLAQRGEIHAPLTLWTIATPQQETRAADDTAAPIPPVDHALLRLSHLLRAAEAGAAQAGAAPARDGQNWAHAWRPLLDAAQEQAATEITRAADTAVAGQIPMQRAPADELAQRSAELADWAARFASSNSDNLAASDDTRLEPQAASSRQFIDTGDSRAVSYFISEGSPRQLRLAEPDATTRMDIALLLPILVIVLLAAGTIWALRRAAVRDLAWRWPQAVGVLLGLAWWSWLTPSGLGWLIVVASLLIRLRTNWRSSPVAIDSSLSRSRAIPPTPTATASR